jgi:hypothetical protein
MLDHGSSLFCKKNLLLLLDLLKKKYERKRVKIHTYFNPSHNPDCRCCFRVTLFNPSDNGFPKWALCFVSQFIPGQGFWDAFAGYVSKNILNSPSISQFHWRRRRRRRRIRCLSVFSATACPTWRVCF